MRARTRDGFTLIELMVAMALTLFIMVILSQAFVTALETFSGMKGLGDMQYNLRTALVMLRDDLSQDHLEGKRRLSDLTMVVNGPEIVAHHPQAGFFAVRRTTPFSDTLGAAYHREGATDGFGVPSYSAVDHMIYMTVKRKGNRQENFFNTALQGDAAVLGTFFKYKTAYDVPALKNLPYLTQTQEYTGGPLGFYSSQWAEVLYFLVRTGSTEQPNDPTSTLGTPTYALYRAQFVMVPDGTNVSGRFKKTLLFNGQPLERSTFAGMSCNPDPTDGNLAFYSPADAAAFVTDQIPQVKRVIPDLLTANPEADPRIRAGATLVCPYVISFQVQILRLSDVIFVDVPNFTGKTYGIYDTARLGVTGYPNVGLKGIQVTLRVWDNNTRQTRQATVVQDL